MGLLANIYIIYRDDDFGYMPRGTNGTLRHGVLYNAKYGLSYFCIRAGCPFLYTY